MPTPADLLPSLWAVGLTCSLAGCPVASAAEVLVFTDLDHPVTSVPGARVVELDLPARTEADLAKGLPADPSRAAVLAQQRLRAVGDALQRRLRQACQGVADAWRLGVTKLPAVVVDRRFVVYGDADVRRAVAHIDASLRAQR